MRLGKNIGRFWLWVGVLLLIELAAITLWKRWYWFFPQQQTSELYQRYAGAEDVDAAYVTDYRVNDSLFVDVTVLQATTDTAWARLQKDLNVSDLSVFSEEIQTLFIRPNAYECYYRGDTIVQNGQHVISVDIYSYNRYYKRFIVFHSLSDDRWGEIVSRLTKDLSR